MKKFLLMLSMVVVAQVNAAEWIRPERVKLNATFVVAKDFACTKQIAKSTLKTSAAGIGVWKINGAKVGGGWYDQNVAWACERWQGLNCSYGRPAAWAELELEFTDGTSEKIGTDATCPEDLADKLRVSREDEPQHSLSHPMHCGWLCS